MNELFCDKKGYDSQDSSEHWLKTTDRGGLYCVTDLAFKLYIEVEVCIYEKLSQLEHVNLAELHNIETQI